MINSYFNIFSDLIENGAAHIIPDKTPKSLSVLPDNNLESIV